MHWENTPNQYDQNEFVPVTLLQEDNCAVSWAVSPHVVVYWQKLYLGLLFFLLSDNPCGQRNSPG